MLAASHEAEIQSALLSGLAEARCATDNLFELVQPDSVYERPIPERHRIIFYVGHLEAFDQNLLSGRLLSSASSSPDLDRLFAFGIDPVGGGLPTDQPSDWPALGDVRQYVQRTRDQLDRQLESLRSGNRVSNGEFSANLLLNVAIEHRLMHAETLAYMLHRLPYDRKVAPPPDAVRLALIPAQSEVVVPAGPVTLGLSRDGSVFGWDNEFERHTVDVPEFAIDRYKTRNSEYLEFMNAGGYDNRALWSDADWAWKESNRIVHPAFWRRANGDGRETKNWLWTGMFAAVPLPPDWPVYVSHAEASAFARWKGKRLPTEMEWQRAAYGSEDGQPRNFPWGSNAPDRTRGNFNFENWDPVSVASHPAGASAWGVEGMLGNGWEWTSSVFAPFEGFQPFPFYPGYSADFFDGKHYVIKGASSRTAACMLRPSFRNWFQPHYQHVYAGFRCVSNQA